MVLCLLLLFAVAALSSSLTSCFVSTVLISGSSSSLNGRFLSGSERPERFFVNDEEVKIAELFAGMDVDIFFARDNGAAQLLCPV